jgi:hypothetical protein
MERKRVISFLLALNVALFGLMHFPIQNASAVSKLAVIPNATPASDTLVKKFDPRLRCAGSGELTGQYPGWSSEKAIRLTSIQIHNSTYGIYWCRASAPFGRGVISYTVTSPLGGLGCETTNTSCLVTGINKGSRLTIMATDQTGSFPIPEDVIQNAGVVTNCLQATMSCNSGPIIASLPSYGNDSTDGSLDCTFAAVANWEALALGITPDPVEIQADFLKTGGAGIGLTNDQLYTYWVAHPIGGVALTSARTLPTDPVTLKESIGNLSIRAVIAQLHFVKDAKFAGYSISEPGFHWVVIGGFTEMGPIAFSWGRRVQMTWQQWNVEAVTMWRISAHSSTSETSLNG